MCPCVIDQTFLPVFKKLLWNNRDESQLPGAHQSCLVGQTESLIRLMPSWFPSHPAPNLRQCRMIGKAKKLQDLFLHEQWPKQLTGVVDKYFSDFMNPVVPNPLSELWKTLDENGESSSRNKTKKLGSLLYRGINQKIYHNKFVWMTIG